MDNYNVVHIDEKWFFITEEGTSYWVSPGEEVKYRPSASKRHIKKIMFMAAVARPRFDHYRKKYFDGKLGIWPFAEIVLAK